jgi:Winged helix DNA-binding domain
MTTLREAALLRLAAQRVAGDGCDTAAEAVGWLTCLQAQDLPGALTSVALRVRGGTRADVEAALDAGEVVRSWPMRGTLHLVPAGDLPWMLALAAPRIVAATTTRRRGLGIDDGDLAALPGLTEKLLEGGALSRDELFAGWRAAGQPTAGQRGIHLLSYLAMTGVVCYGPVRGGRQQQIVLVDAWAPRARRLGRDLDRDEALGEWALRYFRSHGPATVKDFTWWTRLLAADVRTAVSLARPELVAVDVDGTEHLMDPGTPERLTAVRRQAQDVLLLPGFDEFLLGYADRSAALPAEFADRVVPGGNGMFLGTVVAGGQVVGTWRRAGSGARRAVQATPFRPFPKRVATALPRASAALDRLAADPGPGGASR